MNSGNLPHHGTRNANLLIKMQLLAETHLYVCNCSRDLSLYTFDAPIDDHFETLHVLLQRARRATNAWQLGEVGVRRVKHTQHCFYQHEFQQTDFSVMWKISWIHDFSTRNRVGHISHLIVNYTTHMHTHTHEASESVHTETVSLSIRWNSRIPGKIHGKQYFLAIARDFSRQNFTHCTLLEAFKCADPCIFWATQPFFHDTETAKWRLIKSCVMPILPISKIEIHRALLRLTTQSIMPAAKRARAAIGGR